MGGGWSQAEHQGPQAPMTVCPDGWGSTDQILNSHHTNLCPDPEVREPCRQVFIAGDC